FRPRLLLFLSGRISADSDSQELTPPPAGIAEQAYCQPLQRDRVRRSLPAAWQATPRLFPRIGCTTSDPTISIGGAVSRISPLLSPSCSVLHPIIVSPTPRCCRADLPAPQQTS